MQTEKQMKIPDTIQKVCSFFCGISIECGSWFDSWFDSSTLINHAEYETLLGFLDNNGDGIKSMELLYTASFCNRPHGCSCTNSRIFVQPNIHECNKSF